VFALVGKTPNAQQIGLLEEGMEFSSRKGRIRIRKITFSQLEKKVLGSKQKKEKAERPSLFTRIVLPD
jgi:hypothetical protein